MKPEWFAGRLKELREERGWTQQELADRAGLKLAGVRNLEQGRTYPEWPSVLLLCVALGVDPGAFTTAPATQDIPGRGRPPKMKQETQEENPKQQTTRPKKVEPRRKPGKKGV
jgi:transcriptional regulator with XRE-family HTH domain